ncbi:MAG: FHA domain-containing protein, partial [Planctomycetes bacterium]|nr:FHA domain-containing protein [Planctomycetota bacterium]
MIRLTVRHQTQARPEEVIELDKDVVSLGRQSDNDVVLGERTVSRKHATIERQGGQWILKDFNSHFGVFLNKKKITAEALVPGNEIYITPFIIRFDVVEAGAPAPPAAPDLTLGPEVGAPPAGMPQAPAEAPAPPPSAERKAPPKAAPRKAAPAPPPPPPEPEPEPAPTPLVAEEPAMVPEPQAEGEGVLMAWDGSADQAPGAAPPAGEAPSPEPPPAPAPEAAPGQPGAAGFQPWEGALKAEEAPEAPPEEPAAEAPPPSAPPRKDAPPAGIEEKRRREQLEAGRSFGRIRGVLFGFLLLLLPFFPIGESDGAVMFFWNLFGKEGTGPGIAMFLGAAGLGLLLIAASIFGSGLFRGFLQTLFAGAYLGVVVG